MATIFKKLTWKGIYSYSDKEQEFEFKPGFFLILGDNGSGKSSFLNIITLALFDKAPSVNKGDAINESIGHGSVRLDFIHDDNPYYVSYKRSGKNFYWELYKDGVPVITGAGTGAYIEKLLGYGYDQFVNAFYLTQNSHFSLKLFFGDPGDRLAILSRVFGLDRYLDASETAKVRLQEKEKLLQEKLLIRTDVESKLSVFRDQLEKESDSNFEASIEILRDENNMKMGVLKKEESLWEQRSDDYKREYDEFQLTALSNTKTLAELESDKKNRLERISSLEKDVSKYNEYLEFKKDYEFLIKDNQDSIGKERVLVGEQQILNNKISVIDQNIKNLIIIKQGIDSNDATKCDKCGSLITPENRESYRKEIHDKIDILENERKSLADGIGSYDRPLESIRDRIEDNNEHIRRFNIKYGEFIDGRVDGVICDRLELARGELDNMNISINRIEKLIAGYDKKKADLCSWSTELAEKQKELQELSNEVVSIQSKISMLEEKRKRIDDINGRLLTLEKDKNEIESTIKSIESEALAFKFWVSGFKELATLRLLKYIEGINSKMESLLSGFGMNCWIDVLEAKKSAKDMYSLDSYKRKANLFVSADGKKSVPIEAFSGGERQLLSLAMVLALGNVIGLTNYMGLDEVFGSLDVVNRTKIIELLDRERKEGLLEGRTVLVVTHDDEIKNASIWDGVITIKKEDGLSTIDMGGM